MLSGTAKSSAKHTPSPVNPHEAVKDDTPLNEEMYAAYRSCVGVLLYIGPDRPECLYAIKILSAKCTCPTNHEWHLLCHLVRYLKTNPEQGILMTECSPGRTILERCLGFGSNDGFSKDGNPFGGNHLIEAVSDASWAGEPDRKSVSAMALYLNGNLLHVGNRRQKVLALSSCESELHAALATLQEGLFLKNVMEFLCDESVTLLHRVDSSSCRSLIQREGLSRTRHIDLCYLWVQQKYQEGLFSTSAISTHFCPPDLMTKAMARDRMLLLMYMLGVANHDGVVLGEKEFEAEWTKREIKKAMKVSINSQCKAAANDSLRRLLLLSCIGTTEAACAVGVGVAVAWKVWIMAMTMTAMMLLVVLAAVTWRDPEAAEIPPRLEVETKQREIPPHLEVGTKQREHRSDLGDLLSAKSYPKSVKKDHEHQGPHVPEHRLQENLGRMHAWSWSPMMREKWSSEELSRLSPSTAQEWKTRSPDGTVPSGVRNLMALQLQKYSELVQLGVLRPIDVDRAGAELLVPPHSELYTQCVAEYRAKHPLEAASSRRSGQRKGQRPGQRKATTRV